jgi:hypothetical protein
MKPSWPVLVCASLCLSAGLAQDRGGKQPSEVQRLRGRVAKLEKRLASLEQLVIRLAASAEAGKKAQVAKPKPASAEPPKPTVVKRARPLSIHDYFVPRTEGVSAGERVPGLSWLRRVPGLIYARPRSLSAAKSLRVEEVLRAVIRRGGKALSEVPFDTTALGFRDGDRVLSVNGVRLDRVPDAKELRLRLRGQRRLAVLMERKAQRLVLSFELARPMVRWRDWPRSPSPRDLAARYRLVMASVSVDGAERNTVIVQERTSARSVTLAVGDQFDGYRVLSIGVHGTGEAREAEVTCWTPEGKTVIRLSRKTRPR